MLARKLNICDVCEKIIEECICCPESGHICPLDSGESFCPICGAQEPSSS